MVNERQQGFRTDINGLRAWAVLAVILFHFKITGFDGGYVGVDIFFVISGFLMVGIISRALEQGAALAPISFLWKFYLARGKRIWPALLVMCACLYVLGWFITSTDEFVALSEQTRSAVLFFSNVKFWSETGYFAASAHSIWLLHTWSLSVEWQFYLILPVAMLLVWKIWPSPRVMFVFLAVSGALSLSLCLYISAHKPSTAFFLLPFRAWEMIAGGMVALSSWKPRSDVQRLAFELAGLGLIIISIATFGHLVWPDWHALIPVLGAMLVLMGARNNSIFTDWLPLRWIGERSYSMYLWHWPLLVFLYYVEKEGDALMLASCIGLTFLLGHLSYELVETRMRQPLERMRRTGASVTLLVACVLISAPATLIAKMNGIPGRLPVAANQMFLAARDHAPFPPDCSAKFPPEVCDTSAGKIGLIVLGDSHAAALFSAVQEALPRKDLKAVAWTMEGCGTMRSLHSVVNPAFRCDSFMDWVMQREQAISSSVPVLIINRGSLYMEGPNEAVTDDDVKTPGIYFSKRYASRTPEFYREVQQNLIDTACAIAKHHPVYMMRPVPEMRVDVPKILGRAIMVGRQREISVSMEEYAKRHALVIQAQDQAKAQCGITILDPLPHLCPDGRCQAVVDSRSMYFDDDHLSLYGARHLTPMFATIFARDTVPAAALANTTATNRRAR